MRDQTQERLLGGRGNGPDGVVAVLPADDVADVSDGSSILNLKRAIQNSHVGTTRMGKDSDFCSKRHSRSQVVINSGGSCMLKSIARDLGCLSEDKGLERDAVSTRTGTVEAHHN